MSNNSLENQKDHPNSGKGLPECDFAMMLQGKKYLWVRLEKVRQEQEVVFCEHNK